MTDIINHAEREHALCSASGAERWMNCPGSVAMCELAPSPPSSKYALEGTKMHELCEKFLEPIIYHYTKTKDPETLKISKMINEKDLPGLSIEDYPSEMREYAYEFVDIIWDKLMEHRPKNVYVEKRVTLDEDLGMFGTADLFFGFKKGKKKILSIFDIKYGKGKVVEPSSPQLIYYALAVQKAFVKITFDEFWLYIYQPRADHPEGILRRHILKKKEADAWLNRFTAGAKKALSMIDNPDKVELKAGEHCLFCDAKAVCKAHAGYIDERAGLDFTDDPSVLVPAVSEQRSEIREFMSDEQISKLLSHRKEIEKFLSSLVEYAINRDQEGDPIPGWKVVEGRSQRKWIETSQVVKGLKKLGINDPYDRKLKGLGAIERELKDVTGATKKAVSEMITDLVTYTIPGKTLVEDSDPRPAIDASADAASDFAPIQTQI